MSNRRTSAAAPLLSIADSTLPFTSSDGQAFVRLKYITGGIFAVPIRSQRFRDWFFAEYNRQHGEPPNPGAFRTVVHHLEARAADDPRLSRLAVWRRIGARGHSRIPTHVLLDLANPDGKIVEISPDGWKTVVNTVSFFQQSRSTFDLPDPQQPEAAPAAALQRLRSRLNLAGRADWLRCLAWLITAFFPHGPFPILILRGPSGSGKSTAARLLRYVVDPSSAPFAPMPHTTRQLLALARYNWILAFDHITSLSPPFADALCRLTSGAGICIPEAITPDPTRDPVLHFCRRPIILTTDDRWTPPPDLARRSLVINLPAIPSGNHLPECTIIDSFAADHAAITGALCSVVAAALKRASAVRLSTIYPWAVAAAKVLDCTDDEMAQAIGFAASHPLLHSIAEILHTSGRWSGTPTELLALLPQSSLYKSPRGLSQQLNRLQANLAEAGILLRSHRRTDGTRIIEISDANRRNTRHDASKTSLEPLQPHESRPSETGCNIPH